jgi:hypothetical protein
LKRHRNKILLCKLLFLTLLLAQFPSQVTFSQTQTETVDIEKEHSPTKATWMSAALPGLGQAYNKKYWKIPIIYAGFGTLYYFIRFNGTEYRKFRDAYNVVALGDSANFENHEYVIRYNANLNQLQEGRNYYRRNLELNYIMAGLLYILNIIDASVDANLYNFDVSDDLSLRFDPISNHHLYAARPAPGLTLRYRF